MHTRPVCRLAAFAAAATVAIGLAGCVSASSTSTPTPTSSSWSYSGEDGPAHWDAVAKACKKTAEAHESPIDIKTSTLVTDAAATPVKTHYAPAAFHLENNGHTIEAVADDTSANTIERDGTTYSLQQFHFHADSEHTIDGKHAAAELHLVHKSASGEVAVCCCRRARRTMP
ncbi:anthranilate synthase component I [Leifsonia xyli subsp. cynodontis DSM 46306]|uniref:carbonic anhydrase n=1 Tax=Leifsonia xyli subsp. cynodontis DSM 46306 TaxID=1389489 RepID=U3PE57_LEIXC|nr:carbonic anhydrase family protein [Leifsonia xyli]AGW41848.1 anthranilate synthase component I [Leifsonia xyli subsp. cynodontis DSM 46306]